MPARERAAWACVRAGVMCLDFHPSHAHLLAAGLHDGSVLVLSVHSAASRPPVSTRVDAGKHADLGAGAAGSRAGTRPFPSPRPRAAQHTAACCRGRFACPCPDLLEQYGWWHTRGVSKGDVMLAQWRRCAGRPGRARGCATWPCTALPPTATSATGRSPSPPSCARCSAPSQYVHHP